MRAGDLLPDAQRRPCEILRCGCTLNVSQVVLADDIADPAGGRRTFVVEPDCGAPRCVVRRHAGGHQFRGGVDQVRIPDPPWLGVGKRALGRGFHSLARDAEIAAVRQRSGVLAAVGRYVGRRRIRRRHDVIEQALDAGRRRHDVVEQAVDAGHRRHDVVKQAGWRRWRSLSLRRRSGGPRVVKRRRRFDPLRSHCDAQAWRRLAPALRRDDRVEQAHR